MSRLAEGDSGRELRLGRRAWLCLVSGAAVLALFGCGEDGQSTPTGPDVDSTQVTEVAFADTALAAAVRQALALPLDQPVTKPAADTLTTLAARERGITAVAGIESLKALRILDLANNGLRDVGPLAALDSLVVLDLSSNQVSDVTALSGLRQLRSLFLDGNPVGDAAPLVGLGALDSLSLSGAVLTEASRGLLSRMVPRGVHVVVDGVALGGQVQPSTPMTFAYTGRSRSGERLRIWLGDTMCGSPYLLVDETGADFDAFDWSPDGAMMVLRSNREDTSGQTWYKTYMANSDGSGLRAVSDFYAGSRGSRRFAWSPDGSRIAYVEQTTNAVGEGNLWVMEADGSAPLNLTRPDPDRDASPAWSPDGRLLSFIRGPVGGVYLIDPDTGVEQRIADGGAPYWGLSWSPTGEWVVYTDEGRGQSQIVACEVATGRTVDLTGHASWNLAARWSPDGSRIAFLSTREQPDSPPFAGDVFLMAPDGSDLTRATPSGVLCGAPAWSPDGRYLAYGCEHEGAWFLHVDDLVEPANSCTAPGGVGVGISWADYEVRFQP